VPPKDHLQKDPALEARGPVAATQFHVIAGTPPMLQLGPMIYGGTRTRSAVRRHGYKVIQSLHLGSFQLVIIKLPNVTVIVRRAVLASAVLLNP